MTTRKALLGLCCVIAVSFQAHGAPVAFQNPGSAPWGNWTRNSVGSIYVAYDLFGNPRGLPTSPVLPDTTPDVGSFGTAASNGAILLTKKKGSTSTPAAFITGSSNIYSFSDVLDFDLIVQAGAAHIALGSKPVTVALQLSILGSDLDFDSVKLLGQKWETKTLLKSGSAAGPAGTGTGVDNEYLFLWHLTQAMPVYTFDFSAISTSLSLDAVTVDIGLSKVTGNQGSVPPIIPASPVTTVPLPPAFALFATTLLVLAGASYRRQRS